MEGKEAEALDYAMRIIRFGHMLEGGGGGLMNYMCGRAYKQVGLTAFRSIIAQDRAWKPRRERSSLDLRNHGVY